MIDPSLEATLVALRRELHRHPELSGEEAKTAARIAEQLRGAGIAVRTDVGGHGLIAELPGTHEGPFVALRADLDALPLHEATGLPFASEVAGVMHACGHDGHSSMLVGAALLLKKQPAPLPVRCIWQPAEEVAEGALAVIADGALDDVAMVFGGHLDRHYPAGTLVVTDGPVNAATDEFRIHIRGETGHGARPHEAIDAVVIGSLLVTALQTVVSREVNPADPSVVSVGTFNAGTASNVIAGEAILEGTIRALSNDVRMHLQKSMRRICEAVAQLHEARISVEFFRGTPALVNVGDGVRIAREAATAVVGSERVQALDVVNMGGEDFACFLEHTPGAYIRFGGQVPGRESFPAHSGQFDFDERAIAVGAAWFAEVARRAGTALLDENSP